MTQSPFSADELRALADIACDSTLTEDDVAQLERLLSGNVEAQQSYLAQVCLDTWLRSQFARPAQEPAPPRPSPAITFLSDTFHGTVGYFSSGWPAAYLMATAIFGVGLLIGSVVHVSQPAQVARQSSMPAGWIPNRKQNLSAGLPEWSIAAGNKSRESPIPRPSSRLATSLPWPRA